jgi:hypothetical protein
MPDELRILYLLLAALVVAPGAIAAWKNLRDRKR